jgi:hypothetical protein
MHPREKEKKMSISARFLCKTVSEINNRDHWRIKAKRTRIQKKLGFIAGKKLCVLMGEHPIKVTLIRYGVRLLDDDNLRSALKAVRDGVAKALGKDDSPDNGIVWTYRQEKKKGLNEVGISIEHIPEWEYQNKVKGLCNET